MVTKLGQFTKLGPFSTFQLFKLSKLCYHFLSRFENENNCFCIFSKKKKKWPVFLGPFLYTSVLHFFVVTVTVTVVVYRNIIFFGKIDWSMNSGLRWAGDSEGYKKIYIFIFKTWQKMVTKLGQFKTLKCRERSQLCKLSKLCYHFLSSFCIFSTKKRCDKFK